MEGLLSTVLQTMSSHTQCTATSKVGSLDPVRDVAPSSSSSTTTAKGDDGDEGEYEETIFAMTLTGIFDPNVIRESIATGSYRFAYANTAKPVVQIGDNLFAGAWDDSTVGTDLFISTQRNDEENGNAASGQLLGVSLYYVHRRKIAGKSDRRLNCRKVFVSETPFDAKTEVTYEVLREEGEEDNDQSPTKRLKDEQTVDSNS